MVYVAWQAIIWWEGVNFENPDGGKFKNIRTPLNKGHDGGRVLTPKIS